MKIVLATPLYPPDIEEPAPYVKEFAGRLSENGHTVVVIVYGHLPEKIPGVHIIAIDKRRPLPLRLISFMNALWRSSQNADILYAQNGASVELPLVIISLLTRRPFIIRIGDQRATKRTSKNMVLGMIHRLALRRARMIVTDTPAPRPEILPFAPTPTQAIDAYHTSWNAHVRSLTEIFNHA